MLPLKKSQGVKINKHKTRGIVSESAWVTASFPRWSEPTKSTFMRRFYTFTVRRSGDRRADTTAHP